MLALDAPRTRAQFRGRQRRRVVDEDLGVLQLLGRAGDARPVVLGQLAAADIAQVHAAHRRQHARQDLLGRHFQREDGDRGADAFLERRVFGHVDGQRGLTHRWAAGDDQQVAATQSAGLRVEVDEAGGQAARLVRVVVEIVDLVDERRQRLARADVALAARAALGDRENAPLGLFDQVPRRFAFFAPHRAGDLTTRGHQRAQQRAFLDDLRVGARVGGARRIARQRAEVGKPADFLQFPQSLQMLGHRDRIAGLRLARQRRNALEDEAVIGAEEVFGRDHVADVVPGVCDRACRPPSTACSASMECGGARRSDAPEPSRRNLGVLDM